MGVQSHYWIGFLNNGQPVPNISQHAAHTMAYPGVIDWLGGTFEDIGVVIKTVAACFGIGTPDYEAAVNALKDIFNGADYTRQSKGALQVYENGAFDLIQVYYQAWSDDDEFKPDCCKMAAVPQQAQLIGETLQNYWYEAKYQLIPDQLQTGLYRFIGGAVDDGWAIDAGVVSQLDLHFIDTMPPDPIPAPPIPEDPPPPAHSTPKLPVTAEIAANYALLSTLMAEFGIYMGTYAANRTEYEEHYKWAFGKQLHMVEAEIIRKVRELAKHKQPFEYIYGLLSTELAKIVALGDEHSNSLNAQGHRVWARNSINQTDSTEHSRNELLRKIYVALERPVSVQAPEAIETLLPAVPETQLQNQVARFMETFQQRTRPKRTDPKPASPPVEILPDRYSPDMVDYKPPEFEVVPARNIKYLQPLLRR